MTFITFITFGDFLVDICTLLLIIVLNFFTDLRVVEIANIN